MEYICAHKLHSRRIWDFLCVFCENHVVLPELYDWLVNCIYFLKFSVLGSLLIGKTPEELDMLKRKVKVLTGAGLEAEYLSGADLLSMEPALLIGDSCGAAFLPNDCQLDAHRTAAFIEKVLSEILISSFYLSNHVSYNILITS